jgi:hypothetical protein
MESVKVSDILSIASSISVFLPLVFYLSKIKHASKRIHIIGALIIASALCDLIGFFLMSGKQSTYILFNAYYAILFFLLTWFYYEVLFINTRRMIVWLGLAIYLQSFILITIYVQGFHQYQTLMWVITAIIMIIYSISYFFYSLSTIPTANIFSYAFIWINIGVLIYFCLNLFLFILGNHVLTKLDQEMGVLIWSFHNVNNIIKNILFAIGIYFYKRKIADFQ